MNLTEKAKLIHHTLKTTLSKRDLLASFRWMYSHIPAYKKFIDVERGDISSVAQPNAIPIMTKGNYIERYPLAERMRPDAKPVLLAQSSGTTGEPIVWPIGESQILQSCWAGERILKFYKIKKTVACITLELAEWYGGLMLFAGGVLVGYKNPGRQLLLKTDEKLTNLPAVLTNQDADAVLLITYPELAEKQLERLKQIHIDNIKLIGLWVIGGSLTLERRRGLQNMFPDKKFYSVSGYFSSDAGTVGMNGVISLQQGIKPFPEQLEEEIAERYDHMAATVFMPFPEVQIEIIDNIFHLTNIYNPVPILRYRTDDIGGKADDIEFHKPLYWVTGRAGDQLIIKGATLNLKAAKSYIADKFNLDADEQIIIRKDKSMHEPPTWTISFKYDGQVDVGALKHTITDLIIENSYEVKRRLETGSYSRDTFRPEINIL